MEVVHCLVYWRVEDAILDDIIQPAGLTTHFILSDLQFFGFVAMQISFRGCEIKHSSE
jgi:hypothetical protein